MMFVSYESVFTIYSCREQFVQEKMFINFGNRFFFVNLVPQCSVGGAQVQTGNHKDVKMDCKYRINKWRFTGVLTCEIDGFYVKT